MALLIFAVHDLPIRVRTAKVVVDAVGIKPAADLEIASAPGIVTGVHAFVAQ